MLVGTFLGWVRSGSASRSSYDVFGLVERLGFSPDGLVGWALRLWPLVPMLLVLCVVSWWWRPDHAGGRAIRIALTAVSAVYAGGTALAVANAPEIGMFEVGAGPIVTVVGAVVLLAGTAVEPLASAFAGRPDAESVSATRPG
jgi:hypothetical protein